MSAAPVALSKKYMECLLVARFCQAGFFCAKQVFVLMAMATATAGSPHHHTLKCRMSLVTPLATVIAVAVAASTDAAQEYYASMPGVMFRQVVWSWILFVNYTSTECPNALYRCNQKLLYTLEQRFILCRS